MARVLLCLFAAGLSAQTIVIKNVTVIDATGAAARPGMNVAIERDRIGDIQKKLRIPRGAITIDGKGKFLIPGLWDMHAHISVPEIYFPLLIANGITGVREMFTGIPMAVIQPWRARGSLSHDVPQIVAPGFIDGPPMLWNGAAPPGAIAVATADDGRFAVDALARTGVDFLKIYNSIPREAYFAIAAEARAIGMVFAGHVPEAVSPLEASEAGQRSQEHLINILLACSTQEDELRAARVAMMLDRSISGEQRLRELGFPDSAALDETYSAEKTAILFRTFVKNGTWHTPTLALLQGFISMRDDAFIHDPRRKYLLKAWSDGWNPSNTFFLRDLTPEAYASLNTRIRTLLARYKKLVGDMHRSGVQFLAGTDANGWNPIYPGFGLHDELAQLVESGLTPMEALQSATRNPAMYLGRLDSMGTVEKGKFADLVLLDADPLTDIHNTQKIEAVVVRGRYYTRADLDKLLASAADRATRP